MNLVDWAACEQLGVLTAGRGEPRTWSVERHLVDQIGVKFMGGSLYDPRDVRWTHAVPNRRAAGVIADVAAQTLRDKLDALDHHYTGYHARDRRSFETVHEDALTWWIIAVWKHFPKSLWLEVAELAEGRPFTLFGVVNVSVGTGDPTVFLETRPAAPIVEARKALVQRIDHWSAGAHSALRTPGLHCSRCPDKECPVRP